MGKALPITGIVAATFAALVALVFVNAAVFFVLPVLLVGSIILLAQRNLVGAIAGVVVLALLVVTALGMAESLTTKKGSTDFGITQDVGRVWAILGCLAVPAGAIAVRWDDADPRWLVWSGFGLAAIGLLLCAMNNDDLADQSKPVVLAGGLLLLGAIAPMVALLRNDSGEPPAAPAATPVLTHDSRVGGRRP